MESRGLYPQLFVKLRLLDPEDWFLLAAVVSLPWLFGGVPIYAHRTAALLLVAGAFVLVWRHGWPALRAGFRWSWMLPALLLAGWAAFQLVPLPPAAIGVLSPTADGIYRDVFPGYGTGEEVDVVAELERRALARVPEAADVPLPPRRDETLFQEAGPGGDWTGWRPLSLMPHAGLESLFWYLALLVGFVALVSRVRDGEMWTQYRATLFLAFILLALFGLVQAATSGPGRLYWVMELENVEHANAFGPYVNPNNFSAVMEMAVPWLAGYALMRIRRSPLHGWGGFLRDVKTPIFLAGTALCFAAGLAAGSKFSAPTMALTLSVLAVVGAPRGRRGRWILGVAGAWVLVAALAVPTLLAERIEEYVEMTGGRLESIDRIVAWKAAMPMVRDYWLTGVGFGASADAFAHYLPRGEALRWEELHNDYLEVLAEGGIVAAALTLWLAVAFGRGLLRRGSLRSAGRRLNLEQLGLLLGLLSLCVHALLDFNHQIPANALIFVALAAMAWTHAAEPREEGEPA